MSHDSQQQTQQPRNKPPKKTMSWWYDVARFVWVLLRVLLNPTAVMTETKNIEESFVKVGESVNKDFIIKLGIQENGTKRKG